MLADPQHTNSTSSKLSSARQPLATTPLVPTTSNGTNLPEPETGRAVLTQEIINSIRTWEDVKLAYASKGVRFQSDQEYLLQAEKDWRVISYALFETIETSKLPEEYPHTAREVGGVTIKIFGIAHDLAIHPDIYAISRKTFARHPYLLAEQGLGIQNFGLYSKGLEIPDHYARGILRKVVADHSLFSLAYRNIRRSLYTLRTKRAGPTEFEQNAAVVSTPEGKEFAQLQKLLRIREDRQMKAFSVASFYMSGDWMATLPTNINLAYKHATGKRYTRIEARSAYMAEFLRHLDLKKCLATSGVSSDATTGDKQFVCGKKHEPEIAYFLENGSCEERVTKRAIADAEIANTLGIEAFARQYAKYQSSYQAAWLVLAVTKGAVASVAIMKLLSLLN